MQTEEQRESEIIRLAHKIADDSNKNLDAAHKAYLRALCATLDGLLGD
ncbi:hypothetical protein [Cypionkella sp.]|nr:hypothetical protein [Cypionkella sp.]MDO8985791.1 hypothetical protein [Cypionkella sp.]MDP2051371.1 hypothetical protein [Cypionkella sp.]